MEPLDFSELAVLLNKSRTLRLDLKPHTESKGQWALYKGFYEVHLDRIPFEVLYLNSKTTTEGILDARRRAFKEGITQVVYAPSLDKRLKAHHELLKPLTKGFFTVRQYLISFLKHELNAYKECLKARAPKYYVDPRVRVPAGAAFRNPNPLSLVLQDPINNESTGGRVSVLLADAGHGKTHLCDHLVAQLASRSDELIPVYISAEQWHDIAIEDLTSLPKTIAHSFRHFGASIGWIDGCEDLFLSIAMRVGLFKIVFDGFDEYVLRSQGRITAKESLDALNRLADDTGANIVFTSRTWFWQSEFGSDESPEDKYDRYYLLPFDQNDAEKYFHSRFHSENSKANRATEAYRQLLSQGKSFSGRGFVLSLVADLIDRDAKLIPQDIGRPIQWIVKALCEREELRQALPINANQQIEVLKNFVLETSMGALPDDSTLDFSIQIGAEHLDSESRRDCLRKLGTHPLIQADSDRQKRWRIKQEQVRIYFIAIHLISCSKNFSSPDVLKNFSNRASFSDSEAADLSGMIVDLLNGEENHNSITALTDLVSLFLQAEPIDPESTSSGSNLSRLAIQVALRAVDQQKQVASTHADRTTALLSIAGVSHSFSNVFFTGTLSRFDFTNTTFKSCWFDNVSWANCKFDENTIFSNCRFTGGAVNYCSGFGLAKWDSLIADKLAESLISYSQVEDNKRQYTEEDLRNDMKTVLEKVSFRKGMKPKTVTRRNIRTGIIAKSKHCSVILDEMQRSLFDEHPISGQSDVGLHLKDSALESLKFYESNNVFTGAIKDCFDRISRKIFK